MKRIVVAAKIQEKLHSIPRKPGVYLFKDVADTIIYVGKAKILSNRVRSYFQSQKDRPNKLKILQRTIFDVEFYITTTERDALVLENILIKKYNPHFNARLKDDKTYPYIRITKEAFPQIYMTRQLIQDGSKYIGPYTSVYDIKLALRTLHKFFQVRTCNFPLSDENIRKKKYRLCLDYHIKQCAAPCEGKQNQFDYNMIIRNVERFLTGQASSLKQNLLEQMQQESNLLNYETAAKIRDTLDAIEIFYNRKQKVEKIEKSAQDFIGIVSEDQDVCICILKVREGKINGKQEFLMVNSAFDDESTIFEQFLHSFYIEQPQVSDELYIPIHLSEDINLYESFLRGMTKTSIKLFHPQRGDKLKLIKMARLNAIQKLNEMHLTQMKRDFIPHGLKSLKRDLHLSTIPTRIECFDNSNIQGTDAVSSMVVFINGKAAKSEYRKFKIKSIEDGVINDFASMYEVITRRYGSLKREGKKFPDLIMVDGGKGQLSSAVQALKDLKIFPHPIIGLAKRLEDVFIPNSSDAQNIPKTSSALKILQQLRDESHRFAITFHRKLRKKRTLTSELDHIIGIGEKRRKLLLKEFGSVKMIKSASLDRIKQVANLPESLAIKIYEALNDI